MQFRSGERAGQFSVRMFCSSNHCFVDLLAWTAALSCWRVHSMCGKRAKNGRSVPQYFVITLGIHLIGAKSQLCFAETRYSSPNHYRAATKLPLWKKPLFFPQISPIMGKCITPIQTKSFFIRKYDLYGENLTNYRVKKTTVFHSLDHVMHSSPNRALAAICSGLRGGQMFIFWRATFKHKMSHT